MAYSKWNKRLTPRQKARAATARARARARAAAIKAKAQIVAAKAESRAYFKRQREEVASLLTAHGYHRYRTIREFAEALLQLVHYQDKAGRNIGYDYDVIRKCVLCRFPTVRMTTNGGGAAYHGKPTKMPYKEFSRICAAMNARNPGTRLPFRIRRHRSADIKKNSGH